MASIIYIGAALVTLGIGWWLWQRYGTGKPSGATWQELDNEKFDPSFTMQCLRDGLSLLDAYRRDREGRKNG